MTDRASSKLLAENQALHDKLIEAEETLRVIRGGEVDALLIKAGAGQQLFSLKGADQSFRILVESMNEGTLTVTPDGIIIYANRRFAQMLKLPLAKVIGAPISRWLTPEGQPLFHSMLAKGTGYNPRVELELITSDGNKVPVQFSASSPLIEGMEDIFYLLATDLSEINQYKRNEMQLRLAASVFTHASEGIFMTDAIGNIIDANDTFTRITGYTRNEVLGQKLTVISSTEHSRNFFATLWHELSAEGHWHGEFSNCRKNGVIYTGLLSITAVYANEGNVMHYVGLISDITTLKAHESELEQISQYDLLTLLPNRLLLADRMRQGMSQSQRRAKSLAVVFLDLDGFKAINDTHGHDTGDKLLVKLSSRMKNALREGDTLARIGGDEFVALLLDLDNISNCEPTLYRLLASAAQPIQIGDLLLKVTASLGVTFYPQAEEIEADQLLRQADQAMYQAKIAGKNRFHLFDPGLDTSLRSYHESVDRIGRALPNGEFVLYYQPKVNMRTGVVTGAEALIRWLHPEKGLLPPADFLPLIENHPLAVELGEWVIDTALRQIETWAASGCTLPVSVNISARQLQQPDFVARLRLLLAAHPAVQPHQLEMEVLETSALLDLMLVSGVIEECRELGVLFALDDFGTGYSSLSYLKRLPVKWLKIDQIFVRNMLNDPDDLSILTGVLGLATAFHRIVIAEGVETIAHGTMLLQLGCELAQGYGIARPMPGCEIPEWVANWRNKAEWKNLPVISQGDFPLLFASAEHRALVVSIEGFLKGERIIPIQLGQHDCRFGNWLDTIDPGNHKPGLKTITERHTQLHQLLQELYALHEQHQDADALARLDELTQLACTFHEQLKKLHIP